MRKKTTSALLFCMMLVFSLSNVTALAATSTGTTATVAFREGTAEFGDASLSGLNNMDIDFGTHDLPIGEQEYEAADGDHTLRIIDARQDGNAGDWDVTVKLGYFDSAAPASPNSFRGMIILNSPSTSSNDLHVPALSLYSGSGARNIVTADSGLNRGNYDTTWRRENILLIVSATAAASITEPAAYTAPLTWTLTVH